MGSITNQLKNIGNDQEHLKEKSYKTAEKLNVRILTHQKYTQPQVEFYDWVLDQLDWNGNETVFDIGCGSGLYADKASARAAHYYAGDLSHGMLLDGVAKNHECVNLDAMTLPLPDNSADVVLANHMIYHIPNQARGVAEFRRILKPTGKMTAVTNSNETMKELRDLRTEAIRHVVSDFPELDESISLSFVLETGDKVLKTAFDNVELRILDSGLVFPEPQPIIDYIGSSRDWWERIFGKFATWDQFEQSMRDILEDHFAKHDEFRVSKKTGVFVCW